MAAQHFRDTSIINTEYSGAEQSKAKQSRAKRGRVGGREGEREGRGVGCNAMQWQSPVVEHAHLLRLCLLGQLQTFLHSVDQELNMTWHVYVCVCVMCVCVVCVVCVMCVCVCVCVCVSCVCVMCVCVANNASTSQELTRK
jgi:hypothetical protein